MDAGSEARYAYEPDIVHAPGETLVGTFATRM